MNVNPLHLLKAGIFFIFLLFLLIIFHIITGFLGVNYILGYIGFNVFSELLSILIIFICIYLKFSLPLMIGTFYGIIYVLEWHWIFAILLTLPGLIFITPRKFKNVFNSKNFKSVYSFNQNDSNFSQAKDSVKTNVRNTEIIDGEYKVINDENEKK